MALLDKQLAGNKRFEFVADSLPADKFAVVNMKGYEALSKPFRFTLTLVSDDANIDMRRMLKESSTLRIYSADGKTTVPYHGVLAEFEQLHQSGGYVFYRAVLVPRLWRLSLNRTSEVYLNEQTIPDILKTVLKDGQLVTSDFEQKLSGNYKQRSYVYQYQESHLDFLSRWMEKEGMYYFFDHDGAADKLMLVDDKNMHDANAIPVSYRPEGELDTGKSLDAVQGFVCHRKPLPKQVVLQDFNYRKADLELKVSHAVSDDGFGDVMIYGENFRNEKEGHRYAKLRAEELICSGEVFAGEATAVGLRSGHFMALSHHYRETFNGRHLVTEVHHEGSQAGALLEGVKNIYGGSDGETNYRNTFKAIPADVQFRAERSTAKPRIAGTMSATVDAEGSGQYAELDAYGQYKVQLPFDRSDKAAGKGSARVRMATPYSGSDHGMHFPLHKGAEVLLTFIDGDPDQPLIVNAVPNSENPSVVSDTHPSTHIIKTAGGNTIELEDKKDSERIHMHSPSAKSNWRIGAATSQFAGVSVFGENKKGIHGSTDETISLNAGKAMVLKVDATTPNLATDPIDGALSMHAKSHLLDVDSTKPAVNAAPATGSYHVYAKHIRMFAEPDGEDSTKFSYKLQTDNNPTPEDAWGMSKLYKLQSFDNSTDLTRTDGILETIGKNKTTYTRANSNSATFGDTASVVHGNSFKLMRGMDQSHTYGLSNSVYFGMKNDMFTGMSNSVSIAAKTSLTLGGSLALSMSADLKVAYGATAEFAAGIKTGVNTVVDVSAKAVAAKAAAVELQDTVTLLQKRVVRIEDCPVVLEHLDSYIGLAGLHMFM